MKFLSFLFLGLLFVTCGNKDGTGIPNKETTNGENTNANKNKVIPNWKKEALHRIDSLRKVDLNITVLDASGNKVEDAIIDLKLVKHDFKFGAVVDYNFLNSSYAEIHQTNLKTYFNSSGFHNALKPKQRHKNKEKSAEKVINWLLKKGFYVRGHALVWEHQKNMRPEEKRAMRSNRWSNKTKKVKVTKLAKQHFIHSLNKWNVQAWDVLNEPIGNHQINDLTSENSFAYWFKLADSIRKTSINPNVKLFINENRVVSGTTPNTYFRQEEYRNIISTILKENAPLEGIGFQSRIKHNFVSPEDMYERLKDFEIFNLPLHATEFEVRDSDKKTYTIAERNQIIEQFMLIYVSHYLVEGIWHWTFYDNKKGKNPWALFNFDGSPTVSGKQWINTMNLYFSSNKTLKTLKNGEINARIFKGDYRIRITNKVNTKTIPLKVLKNETIVIQL